MATTGIDAGDLVSGVASDIAAPLAVILASGLGIGGSVFAVKYGWRKFKGVV